MFSMWNNVTFVVRLSAQCEFNAKKKKLMQTEQQLNVEVNHQFWAL